MNLKGTRRRNEPSSAYKIKEIELKKLRPWPRRARIHDNGKLEALIASIRSHDLIDPIIVNAENIILSGHLRVAAHASLGWPTIRAIRVTHLTQAEQAAYVLAANRLPERGGWDREILALEFADLVDIRTDLDLRTTGFEPAEIDLALGREPDPEEPLVPAPKPDAVSQTGDIWLMGAHRMICGDCLREEVWKRLMGDDVARMAFWDAPYNLKVKGHVTSKEHAEFAMASGEMRSDEFVSFLRSAGSLAVDWTIDGGIHFVCMNHGHLDELFEALKPVFFSRLNLCVWEKNNGGMGSFYRSRYEMIAVYKVGTAPHVNNVQLGKFGRNRSNVWSYPGANSTSQSRKVLADHPTPKPVAMVADAILDASNPNDVVIDGFAGSGTILLAAEQTGRRARGIEIDGRYCDVAIRRWQAMTGRRATLAETGEDFEMVMERRLAKALPTPTREGRGV